MGPSGRRAGFPLPRTGRAAPIGSRPALACVPSPTSAAGGAARLTDHRDPSSIHVQVLHRLRSW
ncbi:MAG: hypothetical protein EA340_12940 [Nitriliruptor sp.]|nr:MAG: hypothetical protein EA340_12940 [Nitriliruptor sp.]